MWSAILSGPVPLKAVAVPRPKASKWGRRLAIFQKRSYPTFRYRRPIKMSLLCPLQMTLPGGFPGGVRGEGSADEAPVALGGAEARAGKKLAKRSSTFRAAITVREKPGRLQRLAILPGRREGCEKLRQPRSLRYVPDGRGRSVAADVPGNPVADRSAPGPTRASVKYGKRIDRQTTDEVRPDGSRAERFSAKAQSIGGFGRLSWPTGRFHLVEDARRDNHALTTARDPGNVG